MFDPSAAAGAEPPRLDDSPGLVLRARFVDLSDVRLHVVEAGPESGPPVLLLHGFPEFWWGWRRQIPALAAAGLRVIAPDQRGYHLSGKPRGVRAYGLDRVTEDARDLLDALGIARAAVVAHDWGGMVGWWLGHRFPERLDRLAILNSPHPAAFRRALRTSREQRRRSRYIFYFLWPILPERKLAAGGFRPLRKVFKVSSRPGTFPAAELDRYAAAAALPGALTGMLNWYRAALWAPPRRPAQRTIVAPVRIVWGLEDVALGGELVAPSAARCERVEIVRLAGAGHWVQHEAADEVNRQLLDFLA
ncbi:MAG: alpha/beta hydrolase [Thermoanaerobaculia bacterium]